jgi:hypothetical protein
MPKRSKKWSPDEVDSRAAQNVADEITSFGRIAPPTAAERAQRQQRDHEHDRQRRERERRRRERDRRAEELEAESERKRRQEQEQQQRRAAAEQARATMAVQQQRNQEAAEQRRLSQLEHEWGVFKFHATQAQIEQRRENYFNDLQATINNVTQLINPPPEPEPLPVYDPPDEKSARMGDPNWDPAEMGKAAIRWR